MKRKELIWISSCKKDLLEFPNEVKCAMGYGLHCAQSGEQNADVESKPLKGFGAADVLEIIDSDASGTYRVVYTIRMPEVVFVLHAFHKKSKQGIKTPLQEINLVKARLKQAQEIYKEMFKRK